MKEERRLVWRVRHHWTSGSAVPSRRRFATWTAGDDVVLEMAMYRAYHRWMADYCGAYPNCLGE